VVEDVQKNVSTRPLFEFGLRLERCPTKPCRPGACGADTSLGLCLPTAHQGTKVHSARVLPARYVPPSGFGYPLGGFLPSDPCRFCFTPAALLGFPLRSVPLSRGIRHVSVRKHPPTVSPGVFPAAEAPGRPAGPRFLGFDPPESPLRPTTRLTHRPPDAPLGFALPGSAGDSRVPDFAGTPLSCLA
jgi:hypothetical protein